MTFAHDMLVLAKGTKNDPQRLVSAGAKRWRRLIARADRGDEVADQQAFDSRSLWKFA
jgi:hypothetical protein